MNNKKKKTKRLDVRRVMEGEVAAKRQRFYETGAPGALVLLVLFIIAASVIHTVHGGMVSELVRGEWPYLKRLLVGMALMALLSISLGLYVAANEPRIVKNQLRGAVLLALLLIMMAAVRLGVKLGWSPYLIVVPVVITAIMMTIAYSQRFALGIGSFLALVSVLALRENDAYFRQSLAVLLTTASGLGVAVLMLKEIRTRSRLVKVCGAAAAAVFATAWVVGLWQALPTREIFINSLLGGAGALSVGIVVQAFLPLIEKLFRTATSLTLLDYSEATKPLLKRLAVEAPGTFNHSWQIGMMAEAAAEAIGANGLLCRVGSYYHDVGKLNKPRYFVENQAERFNQHKELSPSMSRMIIIGHVRDGLELAREYKIPRVLHQFISTHHGTTLVEYFFHEATKKESESGRSVAEAEFRYPGPKPATKEAAIVMLADAVEGATRAMQEPTPSRIESVVQDMAMRRLQDGQFDECDLTMRQLQLIEASLVKSLCGMYHARIAYPQREKAVKAKAKVI